MSDIMTFSLADGTTVAVTPANARTGTGAVSLGDRLQAAEQSLRQALAPVTAAASEMMDGFRELSRRPDEVELGFSVTLDSRLGGVIASAKASAHLDVKLRWQAPDAEPEPAVGDS